MKLVDLTLPGSEAGSPQCLTVQPDLVAGVCPDFLRANKCYVYVGGAAIRVMGTCEEVLDKLGWRKCPPPAAVLPAPAKEPESPIKPKGDTGTKQDVTKHRPTGQGELVGGGPDDGI